MNNTTHGHKAIKNEQTGYSSTIDNMNPIPPEESETSDYHYTEPNRDSIDLLRILAAAKCQTVEEVCEKLERNLIHEQTVWAALKWLKQHHYLPQTESKLQEITKQLTDFLNEPF